MSEEKTFTVFAGTTRVVTGSVETVLRGTKQWLGERDPAAETLLFFEDQSGQQVDFDLRGSIEEVLARIPQHPLFAVATNAPRKGPGRPKLGIVCREVCLLPQHWDWLADQPGGPSGVLRRMVQEAMQREPGKQAARKQREAVERVMSALAGNLPRYEEASRALWARETARFEEAIRDWPEDVREYFVERVKEMARLEESDRDPTQA